MPKTLVNIVTDDNPIPAYLFIKEKYEPGDRLMFISALSTLSLKQDTPLAPLPKPKSHPIPRFSENNPPNLPKKESFAR